MIQILHNGYGALRATLFFYFIFFYSCQWRLAKRIENGDDNIQDETKEMLTDYVIQSDLTI